MCGQMAHRVVVREPSAGRVAFVQLGGHPPGVCQHQAARSLTAMDTMRRLGLSIRKARSGEGIWRPSWQHEPASQHEVAQQPRRQAGALLAAGGLRGRRRCVAHRATQLPTPPPRVALTWLVELEASPSSPFVLRPATYSMPRRVMMVVWLQPTVVTAEVISSSMSPNSG